MQVKTGEGIAWKLAHLVNSDDLTESLISAIKGCILQDLIRFTVFKETLRRHVQKCPEVMFIKSPSTVRYW